METKICSKCKETCNISKFAFVNKEANKRHCQCNSCRKATAKTSYNKRQQFVISKVVLRNALVKQQFKEYKNTLYCTVCGESETICLDFHHLDPTQKEGTISSMIAAIGKKRLDEEIEKCVVVCSNCHRKIHANIIQI
jgi:hypothetical protein